MLNPIMSEHICLRGAMDERVGLLIQRLWVGLPPWVHIIISWERWISTGNLFSMGLSYIKWENILRPALIF